MDNEYDSVMATIGTKVVGGEGGEFIRLSSSDVDALEAAIEHPLPADYRHFLAKYGCTRGDAGTIFTHEDGDDGSSVDVFYGVRPGDTYDLLDRRDAFGKSYGDELPPYYLIIAAGEACKFLMQLAGPDRGRVYLWDPEVPPGDPNSAADPEPIATSFDAFVRSLRVRDY